MSKKRKRHDPGYFPPGHATKRRCIRRAENTLLLMNVGSSPSKKITFLSPSFGEKPLTWPSIFVSPKKCILSTPTKGNETSFVYTPKGKTKLFRSRTIACNEGVSSIFIDEEKSKEITLSIPLPNHWVKHCSTVSKGSFEGAYNIKITKDSIYSSKKNFVRNPSQNKLMKMSAMEVWQTAELPLPSDLVPQWLHFVAFSHIGNDAQKVCNLGLGTNFGNGAMELIDAQISRILCCSSQRNPPNALYLDVIPKWVPGYEKIRLLESITVIVKENFGRLRSNKAYIKVTFNTLSVSKICVTEANIFKDLMEEKFLTSSHASSLHKENQISIQNSSTIEPPLTSVRRKLAF